MPSSPEKPLILTMRDSMAAAHVAAKEKDGKAVVKAINECWKAARDFFADDTESRESFKMRLQSIGNDLKARNYDAVVGATGKVWYQLEQIANAMAAAGQLPDVVTEFEHILEEMTPFDHYVGKLCELTYKETGNPEQVFMFGMLHILEFALSGELKKENSPKKLLKAKVEQNEEAAEEVRMANMISQAFLKPELLTRIEAKQEDGTPRLVMLISVVVKMVEKFYPRPKGVIPRGHYSLVASLVFGIGLHLAAAKPALGKKLVKEWKEKGIDPT